MDSITKEELLRKIGDKRTLVVNVLARDEYEKIHIKGSISVPRGEMEGGGWERLDRTKEIIVHCSSYDCHASRLAAEFLGERGFKARAYEGGMREWAEAGLPTEGRMGPKEWLAERY